MKTTHSLSRAAMLAAALASCTVPALADLIPPEAEAAAKRLRANPKAFDRTDEYCTDKKVGEACTIPGSAFAGGGEGVCKNDLNRAGTIDLSCKREGFMNIDRKYPEGGFVADATICRELEQRKRENTPYPPEWNCTPLDPTPTDQFCAGKAVGAACTVTLSYLGKPEQAQGVCKHDLQQQGFYYQGRRTLSRLVIECQPAEALPERKYTPVGWWQKLMQ